MKIPGIYPNSTYSSERVEYSVHALPRMITRNVRGSALRWGESRSEWQMVAN